VEFAPSIAKTLQKKFSPIYLRLKRRQRGSSGGWSRSTPTTSSVPIPRHAGRAGSERGRWACCRRTTLVPKKVGRPRPTQPPTNHPRRLPMTKERSRVSTCVVSQIGATARKTRQSCCRHRTMSRWWRRRGAPMTGTAEKQHALVAAFSASLSVRPDSERVRAILADEFIHHAGSLWPRGDPDATPAWTGEHTDEILADRASTPSCSNTRGSASPRNSCSTARRRRRWTGNRACSLSQTKTLWEARAVDGGRAVRGGLPSFPGVFAGRPLVDLKSPSYAKHQQSKGNRAKYAEKRSYQSSCRMFRGD
jgi:hypothetical protein